MIFLRLELEYIVMEYAELVRLEMVTNVSKPEILFS